MPSPTILPEKVSRRYRVAIVEDHTLVRDGFKALVQSMPDFEFAWEAGTVTDALEALKADPPDMLTTDISLPDGSGLDITKTAASMNPSINVLVMSIHDETLFAQRALKAGAKGYLMKTAPQEDIEDAIRKVAHGRVALSSEVSEMMLLNISGNSQPKTQAGLHELSDREFEIFQLVGEGQNSHAIGKALDISPKTVDVHKMNIRKKLNLEEGMTLTTYAIRWAESRRLAGGVG